MQDKLISLNNLFTNGYTTIIYCTPKHKAFLIDYFFSLRQVSILITKFSSIKNYEKFFQMRDNKPKDKK